MKYKPNVEYFFSNKIKLFYKWIDQNGDEDRTYIMKNWIKYSDDECMHGLPIYVEFPNNKALLKYKLKFEN